MIAEPGSSFRVYCVPSSPEREENHSDGVNVQAKKKPGGWKAMPYILGNETFERLATLGLSANFTVYLIREFHLSLASAANILNIWGGVSNFAPLIGAFISDTFAGRFRTIAFASFAALMGMLTVTLTAWVPELHPPKCVVTKPPFGHCKVPNKSQMLVLLTGLCFLSVGSGGIRPCSIPFGVDQFDTTTEKGNKDINSFFNWYYTSLTVVMLISQTAIIYIQDQVSWVVGFVIPTVLMLCSIVLFFVGTKVYVYVEPEGSIFLGICQVLAAAYRKRRLKIPEGENDMIYYNPPSKLLESPLSLKLAPTNQFRFLNKAAMIVEKAFMPDGTPLGQTAMIADTELKPDGTPISNWRLCSVQQVEDVKCLIKVVPIWASGIICFITTIQQAFFTISQAMEMNRHLGPKFQVPPGSISVISMLTISVFLPFYDRILISNLRKITKVEGGITTLQRMGVGIVLSILSMVVAGLVEKKRRASGIQAPLSVFWLSPQLILLGLCEALFGLGMTEFFNKEFPSHMRSIGNSLIFCSIGSANYLSSFTINIIHRSTRRNEQPDWLANDINAGRLDYFYYLLAGMGFVNFMYFLYCAHIYRYKGSVELKEKRSCVDIEIGKP